MGDSRPKGTKYCRGCEQALDLSCFNFKNRERGTPQHVCRVCSREASRRYYQRDPAPYKARAAASNARTQARNRQRLHEYISMSACLDCGTRDFAVLEFDHRDPSLKKDDISRLTACRSMESHRRVSS